MTSLAAQVGGGADESGDSFSRRVLATVCLLLSAIMISSAAVLAPRLVSNPARPSHRHSIAMNAGSASGTGPEAESERPATVVRPLSCERLPNAPGKSMTTAIVDFPPDAYSPRHRHPGSVMAFVLKGTLRSQLAGEPAATFGVGQSWFEPAGAIHLFAENTSSTEPAELLAVFVTDDPCGPLTIFE